jgi:hypothetical protein
MNLPSELDVDLQIQHKGHELRLKGSGTSFVAQFPTLSSLLHFLREFRTFRRQIPGEATIVAEWGRLRIPVRKPRRKRNADA